MTPSFSLTGTGADRLRSSAARILVTGGTGWLGRATLHLLHDLLGPSFASRVACFGSTQARIDLLDGISVEQAPLSDLAALAPEPTIFFHLAFPTKDRAAAMAEADYAESCAALRQAVYGALERLNVEALFVPSSGAAYDATNPAKSPEMRLYGRLKLEDEAAAAEWAARSGGTAAVARIFNLSGPYINKHGAYALASFISDALAGQPIAIGARRPVVRSYVAISELVSTILGVLTSASGETIVFDTAGENAYELGEIANIVKDELGSDRPIERPALVSQDPDIYVGDGTRYRSLRGKFGVEEVAFPAQVRETAAYMARLG
jgi:nucleoside-diphosphate-sugar epimerase